MDGFVQFSKVRVEAETKIINKLPLLNKFNSDDSDQEIIWWHGIESVQDWVIFIPTKTKWVGTRLYKL